jgi:hypothetical protein
MDEPPNHALASETAGSLATRVSNPYAQKRPTAPVVHKNLPLTSRELILRHIDSSTEQQGDCSETKAAIPEDSSRKGEEKQQQTHDDSNPEKAPVQSATVNNDSPYWKRLPSLNLSFSSAEILTVSEYLQHCSAFCNKSVRITGKLVQRVIHSPTCMSLVLTDPLLPPSRIRRPSLGGRRVASFPQTTTPSILTRKRPLRKTPGGLRTPSTFRSTLPTNPPPGSATTTPAAHFGSSRKRPLSTLKNPPDTVETVVQAVLQNHGAVWIVANPAHVTVRDCAVGDLVMVMGEVRPMCGKEEDDESARRIAERLQQQPLDSDTNTEKTTNNDTSPVHCLKARILRNANGTDMKLYTEALLARRDHLRQALTLDNTKNDTKNDGMRPGWGPPNNR